MEPCQLGHDLPLLCRPRREAALITTIALVLIALMQFGFLVLGVLIYLRQGNVMSATDDLNTSVKAALAAMDDAMSELGAISAEVTALAAKVADAAGSGDADAMEAAAQELTAKATALESAVAAAKTAAAAATPASPAPVAPTFSFSPTTLPDGVVGTAYTEQVTVTGGAAPYQFSVGTGPLPDGLSLGAGGAVSGVPTAAGSFSFSVQVHDANNASGTQSYQMAVAAAAPAA